MVVYNLFFLMLLVNYVKLIVSEQAPPKIISDDKSGAHYAKLLKAIIKVNEERVQAIRKVSSLQDYLLTKNSDDYDIYDDVKIGRKSAGDSSEVEPQKQNMTNDVQLNCPVSKASEGEATPYTENDKFNETLINSVYRRSSCCCRKAINKCTKACDRASVSVCRDLSCTKEAKILLDHSCEKYCEVYFDTDC